MKEVFSIPRATQLHTAQICFYDSKYCNLQDFFALTAELETSPIDAESIPPCQALFPCFLGVFHELCCSEV
jgi:hypothetical protein